MSSQREADSRSFDGRIEALEEREHLLVVLAFDADSIVPIALSGRFPNSSVDRPGLADVVGMSAMQKVIPRSDNFADRTAAASLAKFRMAKGDMTSTRRFGRTWTGSGWSQPKGTSSCSRFADAVTTGRRDHRRVRDARTTCGIPTANG